MNDENPIKEYKSFFDRFKKKRNKDIQVVAEQNKQSNKDFEETFGNNYNLNEYKLYIDNQFIKPIKAKKQWYEIGRNLKDNRIKWNCKLILTFIEDKNIYNELVKFPIVKINNKNFYVSQKYSILEELNKLVEFELIEY